MRIGLCGTGYWAAEVHAAGLVAEDGVELAGVWGRDPAKAAALAQRYGTRPYDDVAALLDDVDAVAVALPPDVQAGIAAQAAAAGRHLMLDKPLALTAGRAARVVDAVDTTGVASVVFFTSRFVASRAQWLQAAAGSQWRGLQVTWLGSIFTPGNPFGASPWRRAYGPLWDIGPHALSVALPLLGPVERVAAAARDSDGTVHVVVLHTSGGSSVLSLSLSAPEAAVRESASAYGEAGWTQMPERDVDAVTAYRLALRQLRHAASTREPAACDVRFGAEVVRILEQAQALLPAP